MTPTSLPCYQNTARTGTDRRTNIHLRLMFKKACRITAPFFDSRQEWGDAHLRLFAHQALRAAYPELTLRNIALLFSGVQGSHMNRLKQQRDAD